MGKLKDKRTAKRATVTNRPDPSMPVMTINDVTLAELTASGGTAVTPWVAPARIPGVVKAQGAKIGMDALPEGVQAAFQWANGGGFSEGLGFLGYAYLAELSQRPEYRRVSEIIASEATRKWIKLKGGDPERLKLVDAQLTRFRIKEKFREAIELDGFFGRAQIYIDLGHAPNATELTRPLVVSKAKIGQGKVQNFKVIEPMWSYPGAYNTQSPIAEDFYVPQFWYVMSDQIHTSRLLTIVGRPLPDMLKPAYAFGGLAMSQMLKPYVDNWLRTRQSVSDLVHSFSTMVLATNMETVLQGGSADTLRKRAMIFSKMRDNRGLMAINKGTEELTNVSTPLGTLDKLLAQAQEQMASIAGLPLVILLGVTPAGLNASSDGEIRVHYANIKSYCERTVRDPLQVVLEVVQLDLDGIIDPELTFDFVDLYEMDEKDKAQVRKSDADSDVAYAGAGVVTNDEVRARITADEDSPWFGVDLSAPAPEREDDAAELQGLQGDNDDEPAPDEVEGPPPRRQANDASPFDETKHKRAKDGKFGSGGTGAPKPPGKKKAEPAALPAPGDVRQPVKSYKEIAKKGEQGRQEFQAKLNNVAARLGLQTHLASPDDMTPENSGGHHLFVAPNKSKARAAEKVKADYDGDWSKLRDYVRGSIAVDNMEQLKHVYKQVQSSGLKIAAQVKDKFANPTKEGYRDLNTLVQLDNGMVAELQFHVKEMILAKEKAHGDYAEQQSLQRKNGTEEPTSEWSSSDTAKFNEARERQKAIYSAAWAKVGGEA